MPLAGQLGRAQLGEAQLGQLGSDSPATPGVVFPGAGSLKVQGFAPTIVRYAGAIVTPGTGSLKITGNLAHVNGREIITNPGSLIVRGFAPTITEFAHATRVYVGGIDATQYFMAAAASIHKQSIGRGTATLDFAAPTGGFVPAIGAPIRIVDWGRTLFAGSLQTVQTDRQAISSTVIYHCTAVDRAGICDHRIVLKTYAASEWPDYSNVIFDIVANYLNGEGVTTGGVSPIGSNVYGPLSADLSWNFPTVTQAFDQICTDAGLVWWIDQAGVLYFSDFNHFPAAPFSISELSGNWIGLKVTQDLSTYLNKIYVVGNFNALGPAGSQTTDNDEFCSPFQDSQANAIPNPNDPDRNQTGPGAVPLGMLTSQPIASITAIVVNNVHTQSFYTRTFYAAASPKPAPIDAFDYIWLYDVGGSELRWVRSPASTGDIIEAKYKPSSGSAAAIPNPLTSISGAAAVTPLVGTIGSGVYEGAVILQNAVSLADLNAAAQSELDKLGGIPIIADIETDRAGLEPGQLLPVNVPLSGITSKNLLITSVDLAYMAGDLGQRQGFHSNWRSTVQARSNLDPGNWVKWFERQFARSQNDTPQANFEEAIFVLGTDGSTNPWPVSRPGPVFQATFSATTAPGQTLTFQLVRTSTPAPFPPGQIGGRFNVGPAFTVPGGQIDDTVYTVVQPGVMLSAFDILSLTVTIGGGGPIPAGCVLKVRWQVS